MLAYNRDTQEWVVVDDESLQARFEALKQELLLFQGENPLDTSAGGDYWGVIEGSVYLPITLGDVLNKYSTYFDSLDVDTFTQTDEIATAEISVVVGEDNESISIDIFELAGS